MPRRGKRIGAPKRVRPPSKAWRQRHDGTAWRDARLAQLRRQPCCVDCEDRDDRAVPADTVHHVHALSDGGDLTDPDNLVSLCRSCHAKRENQIRASIRRKRLG